VAHRVGATASSGHLLVDRPTVRAVPDAVRPLAGPVTGVVAEAVRFLSTPSLSGSMKESLVDILCDPLDKSDLELHVTERDGDEIIEGKFVGTVTGEEYPIEDGIPDLRPPDMRDE
jgi:uncharacterized protein YbaR (Trm112 family)